MTLKFLRTLRHALGSAAILLGAQCLLAQTQIFTDVPGTSSFYSATTTMYQLLVSKGCVQPGLNANGQFVPGQFCPNDNIQRQDMAVFIVRAWSIRLWNDPEAFHTYAPPNQNAYFDDVPLGSPQFDYIQKLYELGVTAGFTAPVVTSAGITTPGKFCANTSDNGFNAPICNGQGMVQNYQAAVFIDRARALSDNSCAFPYYGATPSKPFQTSSATKCAPDNFDTFSTWATATSSYFTDVSAGPSPPRDNYLKFVQALGDSGALSPIAPNNSPVCCLNETAYISRGTMAVQVVGGVALNARSALTFNGTTGPDTFGTAPNTVTQFVYSLHDQAYGAVDIHDAQFILIDATGTVLCQGDWGRTQAFYLYGGNTGVTSQFGISQVVSACTASLVSIDPIAGDPTGARITLSFSFNSGYTGSYTVLNQVNYLTGLYQSPWEAVGTLVIQNSTAARYTISSSGPVTVTQGGATSFAATLNALNGYAGSPTFSIAGLPQGVTASFGALANGLVSGVLTASAGAAVTQGPIPLTLSAFDASLNLLAASPISISVAAPPSLSVSTTVARNGQQATVQAFATGGIAPYTYSWSASWTATQQGSGFQVTLMPPTSGQSLLTVTTTDSSLPPNSRQDVVVLGVGASTADLSPTSPTAFYLFISWHDWLVGALGISTGENPYGISPDEFAKASEIIHLIKANLDAFEARGQEYRGRGAEFAAEKVRLVEVGRSKLKLGVRPETWMKIQKYLESSGHNSIRGYRMSPPSIRKQNAALEQLNVQPQPLVAPAPDVVIVVNEAIAFYNGGLAMRSDSTFEAGDVRALDWVPFVRQPKSSRNGIAFRTSPNASASAGGDAWSGTVVLPQDANPSNYKQESFHTYSHVGSNGLLDGASVPPYPTTFVYQPSNPARCIESNGYCSVSYDAKIGLSVPITQEFGKPTHFLALASCNTPIVITAFVTPTSPAPVITWTGGNPGADNSHRIASCVSPGDTDITASVGANFHSTVRIHVVTSAAVPAVGNSSFTHSLIGVGDPGSGAFGVTIAIPGMQGVSQPTYSVNAFLPMDRWAFRVASVDHGYKVGIHSLNRTDLLNGDGIPFPIATLPPPPRAQICPSADLVSLSSAYNAARYDFDTTIVDTGSGPPRCYYWNDQITQRHEDAHVYDFYESGTYWPKYMRSFVDVVESNDSFVVFDCDFASTTSAEGVVLSQMGSWDAIVANSHISAYAKWTDNSRAEVYAHGISNPLYGPIRDALPNAAAPVITPGGFSPTIVRQGDDGYFVVYGLNLNASPTVGVDGYGVRAAFLGPSSYISKGQLNIHYTIATDATLGDHVVSIATAYGVASVTISILPKLN